MTYAKRNSLILIWVWILMIALGWARFHWVENATIEQLEEDLHQKKETLKDHQEIANEYDDLVNQYEVLKSRVDEHSKRLVKARDAEEVYSVLISMSTNNAFTYFNFISVDSVHYDKFGLLKFDVSGEGYYKNFNRFINHLEYGRPLFKIRDMTIEPLKDLDDLGKVRYSFKLQSLFDRDSVFPDYLQAPQHDLPEFTHNSFYPLIHDIRDNDENLPNVEQSRLISVAENFISLRDQKGKIQYLNIGDRVYLGRLIAVDTDLNSATFELNQGGIIKHITKDLK